MFLVALFLIAILTQRGAISLTTTLTDIVGGQQYKAARVSFIYTEAGIQEAKARLMGTIVTNPNFIGDPAGAPDPLWSAYVLTSSTWTTAQDTDYNSAYKNYFPTQSSQTNKTQVVNSLQTATPYWVKIRHKREYDAELEGHTPSTPHYVDGDGSTATHTASNPGNIIYYGYYPAGATAPVQFTTSTSTIYPPVELVRAYGRSTSASDSIEVDTAREVGPPILAGTYGQGNLTFSTKDASGTVSGIDNCGVAPGLPPAYTLTPATTTGNANVFRGNPPTPAQGTANLNIDSYIKSLQPGSITLTASPPNNMVYGTATNPVTVYSNAAGIPTGLQFQGVTGYGLLLVEGNLTFAGQNSWQGPVLVTGTLTLNSGANNTSVQGTVMAGTVYIQNKNPNFQYDSCQLANAMRARPMRLIRWKYRY